MENKKELKLDIEDLLLTKSYENLTSSEKEFLFGQLSEKEYKFQRKILLSSKSYFETDVPPLRKDIKAKAKTALANRRNKQQPIRAFLANLGNYRMPVWQAGLGMACMALLLLFSWNQKEMVTVPEEIYVYKTDTVYKSVPVNMTQQATEAPIIVPPSEFKKAVPPRHRVAKRNPAPLEKQINSSPTVSYEQGSTPSTNSTSKKLEVPIVGVLADSILAKPTGRSIQKDPELANFLVKVN